MSSNSFLRRRQGSSTADAKRLATNGRNRAKRRELQIESLEPRNLMSTTPVQFNIAPDVAARGVYIEVSGEIINDYSATIKAGDYVYYNDAIGDYALVEPGLDYTFKLSGTGAILNLPDAHIKGGQIVIGVGTPPIVTYTPAGLSSPTANTNPSNFFGLFEYAITSAGLDIDLSEVDQVGFPFTITTDPAAPSPAQDGVGLNLTRSKLFDLYAPFINAHGAAAAPFMQSLTAGNGYRIEAPQDIIDVNQSPTSTGVPTYARGGSLAIGTPYYYWITAVSGAGETSVSNVTKGVPYNNSIDGVSYPTQTISVNWYEFAGATGYNVYRSTTNDPTTATKIGSTSGATTTFTDAGLPPGSVPPPTNSYTFNPLNSYFNTAITNFFNHYLAPNSFSITLPVLGGTFVGQTNTNYQYEGHTYTVLQLTGPGGEYVIYQPYFSTNTDIKNLPPPPSWMPFPNQSPGAMVLANDGVFNDGKFQPGVNPTIQSGIENAIVAAFNRGVADNFSIAPSDWSSNSALYYQPGTASNWYAAFLHQNSTTNPATGVSINGLAYGFAYDDQGGDSTNFQGNFSHVYIDLYPWGPNSTPIPNNNPPNHGGGGGGGGGGGNTPASNAAKIEILKQPVSGILGITNSVTFEVLNAQGQPVTGGVEVVVHVVGAQHNVYTVTTDPVTGIGTLFFKDLAIGTDHLNLVVSNTVHTVSSAFTVVTTNILPTGGAGDIVPGQINGPTSYGTNTLPATDVPGDLPSNSVLAAATPWTGADAAAFRGSSIQLRTPSLEAGVLGNFAQLWRGGGGYGGPDLIPPPDEEKKDDDTPKSTRDLEAILDAIVMGRRRAAEPPAAAPTTNR
jgi:hypothetical protein